MSDRAAYEIDKRQAPFKVLRLKLAARTWALRIPVIAREQNISRLIERTKPTQGTPYAGLAIETVVRCCRKAVRRPILMADRPCLREGLLLQRFLTMAGFEPSLHFGVDKESLMKPIVAAHCWVIVGDRIINPPTPAMIEIMAVSRGRILSSGSRTPISSVKGEDIL